MNKKIMIAGAIAIFAVGTVIGNFAIKLLNKPPEPSQETQSLIGSKLPPYNLLSLDGVRENSDQWLGHVQVINFWATWCPPCKREIPSLMELQDQYQHHGLRIIGIALDNLEAVQQYVTEMGINYTILVGQDDAITISEQLGNDMGILPYTVIVDRAGNITAIHYGEVTHESVENEIKPLL